LHDEPAVRHHVYLSPGMFGFGRLGSYQYFAHIERELVARFAAAGHELVPHVIEDLPTASIRRRAARLAAIVSETSGTDPIHLLGHSTGGLDARLAASPATRTIPADVLGWLPRLRSLTTMNTPHYGSPLASFFVTSKGQHVLAALSVLTFAGLTLGAQPLAAASVILGFLRAGERLPFRIQALDRSVSSVVGLVDDVRSPEVRTFLAAIEDDQGAMLQISPESMDLVVAGFEDRPGVVYQSTVSMSPSPKPRRWLDTVGHPWRAVSLSLFFALHRITANHDDRYPCAAMRGTAPWAGDANEAMLARIAQPATLDANDGVVPVRSQPWGTVVWAGLGDHLDVLGHYLDRRDSDTVKPELRHRDWLTSGSDFGDAELAALVDAIAGGMLAA
jgi:triacylglycerol lipase